MVNSVIDNLENVEKLWPNIYSETSIHRFRPGSEKETMDPGKQ
jgi:hypothetical protein